MYWRYLTLSALAWLVSCGGPSGPCVPERWEGRCKLRSLQRVREKEFPVPQVTYQAVYAPEVNPQHPNLTPPEVIREFDVLGAHELALRTHLEQNADVSCRLQEPPPGSCFGGQLALHIPEFMPTETAAVPPVRGCARLESTGAGESLASVSAESGGEFTEHFVFDENSAELSPRSLELASEVASRLSADRGVDCVAIVGELSYGEKLPTAMDRAKNVLHALIARGVDPSRLTTIVPTSPLSATAETEKTVDPKERRVRLRVLLRENAP